MGKGRKAHSAPKQACEGKAAAHASRHGKRINRAHPYGKEDGNEQAAKRSWEGEHALCPSRHGKGSQKRTQAGTEGRASSVQELLQGGKQAMRPSGLPLSKACLGTLRAFPFSQTHLDMHVVLSVLIRLTSYFPLLKPTLSFACPLSGPAWEHFMRLPFSWAWLRRLAKRSS